MQIKRRFGLFLKSHNNKQKQQMQNLSIASEAYHPLCGGLCC